MLKLSLCVCACACPETRVVLTVVLVLVPAVALIVATVYVLIFHYGMIKRWLSLNRYHIPAHVSIKTDAHTHCKFYCRLIAAPITFLTINAKGGSLHFNAKPTQG